MSSKIDSKSLFLLVYSSVWLYKILLNQFNTDSVSHVKLAVHESSSIAQPIAHWKSIDIGYWYSKSKLQHIYWKSSCRWFDSASGHHNLLIFIGFIFPLSRKSHSTLVAHFSFCSGRCRFAWSTCLAITLWGPASNYSHYRPQWISKLTSFLYVEGVLL